MLTGGAKFSGNEQSALSNEVFVYQVEVDEWKLHRDCPINQARSYHSSCNLKQTVYIYGGYGENQSLLSSLEWITFDDFADPKDYRWSI